MSRFALKTALVAVTVIGTLALPLFQAHADSMVWVVDDVTAQTHCTTQTGAPCPAYSALFFSIHQVPLSQAQATGQPSLPADATSAQIATLRATVERPILTRYETARAQLQANHPQVIHPDGCPSNTFTSHQNIPFNGSTVSWNMTYFAGGVTCQDSAETLSLSISGGSGNGVYVVPGATVFNDNGGTAVDFAVLPNCAAIKNNPVFTFRGTYFTPNSPLTQTLFKTDSSCNSNAADESYNW